MSNLEISIAPSGESEIIGEVTADLFGGILINQGDFADFSQDYTELGLTFVRFPGGTFAEKGIVVEGELVFSTITFEDMVGDRSGFVYDLSFPELFNPELLASDDEDATENNYASLSEAMAFCIDNDTELAIILPGSRYFVGVDLTDSDQMQEMLTMVESDVRGFLDRLVAGEYNDGIYPEPIIFEIGNETYGSPIEYAIVSKLYIDTISEVMDQSDIEYQIAFQMNVGSSQFQTLFDQDYFDQYFDSDGSALIPQLEGFTFFPDENLPFGDRILLIEEMMVHILGDSISDIDLLRHHYLAIDIDVLNNDDGVINQRDDILQFWLDEIDANGGTSSEVLYYVSAWTTDSSNTGNGPSGLAAATNTLIIYGEFISLGVDRAAAWGINGSQAYWPDNSPNTVLTFSNQDGVTPGGQMIEMLATEVIGLDYVESSVNQVFDLEDPTDYIEFIFTSTSKTVLFYSVGELDGNSLSLNIDLSGFGSFSSASIENLGTEDGSLYGLAAVEESEQFLSDNTVTLDFDQDYEVIRVVVENEGIEGSSQDDVIEGTPEADFISGNGGSDHLSGWAGDDTIFGDDGSDLIYGNSGADFLYGGEGSDKIFGADGFDFILGGEGSDTLSGQNGDDVLVGGGGIDWIYGGSGNDIIYANGASEGTDFLSLGETNNSFQHSASIEGQWSDEVRDIYGSDVLSGGFGNDLVVGSKGVDNFIFDSGHDTIVSFQGGLDTISIDSSLMDLTPAELVSLEDYAVHSDDGVVLHFDSDNSILLAEIMTWSDVDLGSIILM